MSRKKPINLKKMLRKSPASKVCAAVSKNAGFSYSLVNFSFFSYLKFFSGSIIKKRMFIVSVKPNSIKSKVNKEIKVKKNTKKIST